jgi:hypothetical protein
MGEGKGVVKKIRGGGELLVGYRMEARNEGVFTTPAAHSALEILTNRGGYRIWDSPKATPPQAGWPCPPPRNETPCKNL